MPPDKMDVLQCLRAEMSRRGGSSGGGGNRSESSVDRGGETKKSGRGPSLSTAQYYYDSAVFLGMRNMAGGGITLLSAPSSVPMCLQMTNASETTAIPPPNESHRGEDHHHHQRPHYIGTKALPFPPNLIAVATSNTLQTNSEPKRSKGPNHQPAHRNALINQSPEVVPVVQKCEVMAIARQHHQPHSKANLVDSPTLSPSAAPPRFLLALPKDPHVLNPLHCFVRRNVEVFTATETDIAAPSPGRKNRVMLGQVGIRCIHCSHLRPRERVKRAVCFPPTVGGIYHSVSNMKFDHFSACREMTSRARDEFAVLRASCGRRGLPSSSSLLHCSSLCSGYISPVHKVSLANSTAQYYYDSSTSLGLVDTEDGIRLSPRKVTAAVVGPHISYFSDPPPLTVHRGPSPSPPPVCVEMTSLAATTERQHQESPLTTNTEWWQQEPVPTGLSVLMIAASRQQRAA